jgi:hypothetical protein
MVPLVAGGCYEPLRDTLPQPVTLPGCCWTMVVHCPVEAVQHCVGNVYNLNMAFVRLRELLDLRVFTRFLLFSRFQGNTGLHGSLSLCYSRLAPVWFGFPLALF